MMNTFDEDNHDCIEEVYEHGCHLTVPTTYNHVNIKVISAVAFAIMPEGIWINFIASSPDIFWENIIQMVTANPLKEEVWLTS